MDADVIGLPTLANPTLLNYMERTDCICCSFSSSLSMLFYNEVAFFAYVYKYTSTLFVLFHFASILLVVGLFNSILNQLHHRKQLRRKFYGKMFTIVGDKFGLIFDLSRFEILANAIAKIKLTFVFGRKIGYSSFSP